VFPHQAFTHQAFERLAHSGAGDRVLAAQLVLARQFAAGWARLAADLHAQDFLELQVQRNARGQVKFHKLWKHGGLSKQVKPICENFILKQLLALGS
jgi:hypothetical protein